MIRVKEKQGILSGLNLPDTPEFDACFSDSLSKRLTNRIRKEPQKYRWLPNKVQFRVPASAAHQICAAKGEVFLPCERCFCRAYCTGVPARICICGQCGGVDRQSAASCPARPAQAKKYAGKTSSLLSVPDDFISPHSFSRRKLRAFGIPFLKICVSCNAGSGLSSQSLHFWGLILMRLGSSRWFSCFLRSNCS